MSSPARGGGQRLVPIRQLAELEQLAEDGRRVRRAIRALEGRRYLAMECIREGIPDAAAVERARGWLECWDDLGNQLVASDTEPPEQGSTKRR